jgi:hypothetical protein
MTMWFSRGPGDPLSVCEEESAFITSDQVPDWVRLPAELGGVRLRVTGGRAGACPVCGAPARHLLCEGGYGVAECLKDGFVWYMRRDKPRFSAGTKDRS